MHTIFSNNTINTGTICAPTWFPAGSQSIPGDWYTTASQQKDDYYGKIIKIYNEEIWWVDSVKNTPFTIDIPKNKRIIPLWDQFPSKAQIFRYFHSMPQLKWLMDGKISHRITFVQYDRIEIEILCLRDAMHYKLKWE